MVHGYNNSESDFISELCWALPFNRQGGSYSNKLLSIWNLSHHYVYFVRNYFFFSFWQKRHSKGPTARSPCRLQVPLPNGAEKLELCRWSKPADPWFDPDSFTPSPTIYRAQRFKQMLDQRSSPTLHQSHKYNSITELTNFKFSLFPSFK